MANRQSYRSFRRNSRTEIVHFKEGVEVVFGCRHFSSSIFLKVKGPVHATKSKPSPFPKKIKAPRVRTPCLQVLLNRLKLFLTMLSDPGRPLLKSCHWA